MVRPRRGEKGAGPRRYAGKGARRRAIKGQLLAVVVMLFGIGFLTVVTAAFATALLALVLPARPLRDTAYADDPPADAVGTSEPGAHRQKGTTNG